MLESSLTPVEIWSYRQVQVALAKLNSSQISQIFPTFLYTLKFSIYNRPSLVNRSCLLDRELFIY